MTWATAGQPNEDVQPEVPPEAAFTEEQFAGFKMGFRVCTVVLEVITVWIVI